MSDHYFLAVPLPIHIKENLDDYSKKWYNKLPFKSWTFKDDFHITLSFLGPVASNKTVELMEQIQIELEHFQRFELVIEGIGIFGKIEQPRVWWFGLKSSTELINLQKKIAQVCREIGFSIEKRPYNPHITIAKKYNDRFDKEFIIPQKWEGNSLNFEVNEIVLYKIHPSKKPSYEPVKTVKLK
ncbi:RNA 2',3'-cyclic phosphodiesterase [Gottfriedia luciferensis]|uniref:RNA 2',3'-cyclic phosphodiesterase n=1 Tax=Gottfriedia luciferensis TaxID=178774 RepID=UPI000B445FBD|nr:RNA 2',3'-cyclic phosphodiesterase [Gottfriedia luciferensis]